MIVVMSYETIQKCCPEKAKNELNWVATSSIDDMCVDLWRFQQANPLGYADNNN